MKFFENAPPRTDHIFSATPTKNLEFAIYPGNVIFRKGKVNRLMKVYEVRGFDIVSGSITLRVSKAKKKNEKSLPVAGTCKLATNS